MNTYQVYNRKTKNLLEMTFPTKFEAFKFLITNHGYNWDRTYRICIAD